LVHVEMDWSAALRYDDSLAIQVTLGHVGTTSFSLRYALAVEGQERAAASAVYVIVDAAIQGKASLPTGFRTALER